MVRLALMYLEKASALVNEGPCGTGWRCLKKGKILLIARENFIERSSTCVTLGTNIRGMPCFALMGNVKKACDVGLEELSLAKLQRMGSSTGSERGWYT